MRLLLALIASSFLLGIANATAQKPTTGEVTSVVRQTDGSVLVNGKKVSKFDSREVFFFRPYPRYPWEAAQRRLTGDGVYRTHVGKSGDVTSVEIRKSTGHDILDSAAIGAIKTWRAKPGYARTIDTEMTFHLQPAPR